MSPGSLVPEATILLAEVTEWPWAASCFPLPLCYRESPDAVGRGLGLVAGPWQAGTCLPDSLQLLGFLPPQACTKAEAGTPGPLSLGSLAATTAALPAFLRVLIEQATTPQPHCLQK